MIASLAVIFANLWMQLLEGVNKIETNLIMQTSKKPSEKSPKFGKNFIWNSEGVGCEKCENWFHAKCQNLRNDEYQKMGDKVCFASSVELRVL